MRHWDPTTQKLDYAAAKRAATAAGVSLPEHLRSSLCTRLDTIVEFHRYLERSVAECISAEENAVRCLASIETEQQGLKAMMSLSTSAASRAIDLERLHRQYATAMSAASAHRAAIASTSRQMWRCVMGSTGELQARMCAAAKAGDGESSYWAFVTFAMYATSGVASANEAQFQFLTRRELWLRHTAVAACVNDVVGEF